MPHDFAGNVLQVGDEVIFRGKVQQITTGEEYCNVDVRTVHPAKPAGAMATFWFNAAQLEKVTIDVALTADDPSQESQ